MKNWLCCEDCSICIISSSAKYILVKSYIQVRLRKHLFIISLQLNISKKKLGRGDGDGLGKSWDEASAFSIKHWGGTRRAVGKEEDQGTPGEEVWRLRWGLRNGLGRNSEVLLRTERSGGGRSSASASPETKGMSEWVSKIKYQDASLQTSFIPMTPLFPRSQFWHDVLSSRRSTRFWCLASCSSSSTKSLAPLRSLRMDRPRWPLGGG